QGIRYTGSGILASAISMNKEHTKVLLQHFNVNTPKWISINKKDCDYRRLLINVKTNIGFPCVVKPNDQGSAIGLTICENDTQLEGAVNLAFNFSEKVLIEEFIAGHEITVGIIGNESLPVLEIKPKHSFYDYECKYTHGMSEYEVPAKFPADVVEHLQKDALLAYKAVDCRAYGRIDFRLSNNLEPFCLEVNTLPGLTGTSLLPKAAKAAGIGFEELVDRIIRSSLDI
ncbi:D-alanine--D-alanine ligase, partial [Patescibacteria group bacterium]|nr:D-alanine--D-alanine ligase [Patescibacteria group bacterium]